MEVDNYEAQQVTILFFSSLRIEKSKSWTGLNEKSQETTWTWGEGKFYIVHIVGLGNGTIDLYFGKVMTYDHEQYDNQPKT